jgi:hypothetical protein
MDDYPGNYSDPQSLHKYLYCHANPINSIDPTGKLQMSLCDITITMGIIGGLVGLLLPANTVGERITNGLMMALAFAFFTDMAIVVASAAIVTLSFYFTIPLLSGEMLITLTMIAAGGTTFAAGTENSFYFRQLSRFNRLWPWGKTPAPSQPVKITLSEKEYPEYAQRIKRVNGEGKTYTLDRVGALSRRKAALSPSAAKLGFDRDEWPPAIAVEGGAGADVSYMDPSVNRAAGASIGNQLRKYEDGTKFTIDIIE